MVHGMLLDGGSEFLIRPDPATVDNKEAEGPAAAAVGPDTDTVRDSNGGSGRALGVSSTDALDVAVMTEAETYKDFHSAFVVRGAREGAVMRGEALQRAGTATLMDVTWACHWDAAHTGGWLQWAHLPNT